MNNLSKAELRSLVNSCEVKPSRINNRKARKSGVIATVTMDGYVYEVRNEVVRKTFGNCPKITPAIVRDFGDFTPEVRLIKNT